MTMIRFRRLVAFVAAFAVAIFGAPGSSSGTLSATQAQPAAQPSPATLSGRATTAGGDRCSEDVSIPDPRMHRAHGRLAGIQPVAEMGPPFVAVYGKHSHIAREAHKRKLLDLSGPPAGQTGKQGTQPSSH